MADLFIPPAELRRLYMSERWSMQRIAGKYGCSISTVRKRLDVLGIQRRASGRPRKAA